MSILVTGASGQLGGYVLRELRRRSAPAVAWTGSRTGSLFGYDLHPIDLTNPDQLAAAFRAARPTSIIHTAALASVIACQRQPERAEAVNATATARLAELAEAAKTRFLFVSTDLVFDGEKGGYCEEDQTNPLSHYGRTKIAAERAVSATLQSVVVRVSLLFGPSLVTRSSFFDEQITSWQQGRSVALFEDEWRTPLSLATAARAIIGFLDSDQTGVLHLGGPERMSRLEMGRRLARYLGLSNARIESTSRNCLPALEPRPRDTSLDSTRWRQAFPGVAWPTYDDALAELLDHGS